MNTDKLEMVAELLRHARQLPEGERRRAGAQATRDRFFGAEFDWASGMHCVKLAHAHLRNMGKRPPALPKVTSPAQARKALAERGWDSVSAMLDGLLERIPPAMMRVGDLAVVDGDEGFESVLVFLGPRKLMGWLPEGLRAVVGFDDGGAAITRGGVAIFDATLGDVKAAWRV